MNKAPSFFLPFISLSSQVYPILLNVSNDYRAQNYACTCPIGNLPKCLFNSKSHCSNFCAHSCHFYEKFHCSIDWISKTGNYNLDRIFLHKSWTKLNRLTQRGINPSTYVAYIMMPTNHLVFPPHMLYKSTSLTFNDWSPTLVLKHQP